MGINRHPVASQGIPRASQRPRGQTPQETGGAQSPGGLVRSTRGQWRATLGRVHSGRPSPVVLG